MNTIIITIIHGATIHVAPGPVRRLFKNTRREELIKKFLMINSDKPQTEINKKVNTFLSSWLWCHFNWMLQTRVLIKYIIKDLILSWVSLGKTNIKFLQWHFFLHPVLGVWHFMYLYTYNVNKLYNTSIKDKPLKFSTNSVLHFLCRRKS